MVVPIENFEPYSGDWIVWFAERQAKPGDTPFVRAPLPLRKYESVDPVLPGARTELRVQVAGTIRQDGKLEGLTLLRDFGPGISQAVLKDLSAWEFKPATRDSAPVDVDVVIEVPYSLPPQIAKSSPELAAHDLKSALRVPADQRGPDYFGAPGENAVLEANFTPRQQTWVGVPRAESIAGDIHEFGGKFVARVIHA